MLEVEMVKKKIPLKKILDLEIFTKILFCQKP